MESQPQLVAVITSAIKYYATVGGLVFFVLIVATGQWLILGGVFVLVLFGIPLGYLWAASGESQEKESDD